MGLIFAAVAGLTTCSSKNEESKSLEGRCFTQNGERSLVAKVLRVKIPYSILEFVEYQYIDLDSREIGIKSRMKKTDYTADDVFEKVYPTEVNCAMFDAYKETLDRK